MVKREINTNTEIISKIISR